jgi:hypothetical protein
MHYAPGDHANAGRVPLSKTGSEGARPASARPASGRKKLRKKKAGPPPPPWGAPARPLSAAARRSVLSPSAKANAASDGAAQEKALVDQLTRALSTLEERVATMSPDELRESVSAASKAAATASKLTGMGGRSSVALAAKVNKDLEALERITGTQHRGGH